MPDYKNAKIYKITNNVNDKIYIGTTLNTLYNRMALHRYVARDPEGYRGKLYRAMIRHGIENFRIELIRSFSCSNAFELAKEEYNVANNMLKQDVKLYNSVIDGVYKRGSLYFRKDAQSWIFQWRQNGKLRNKSYSANKYGYEGAKMLAEEYRDTIYPIE